MSKLAIMDYDEYVNLCDAIREKTGTSDPLTASQAKEAVSGIGIINNGLLDGSVETIVVPKEVKKIRARAFYDLQNLKEVVLHNEIEEIGYWAFCNNNIDMQVFLPNNLKKLDQQIFSSIIEPAFGISYIYEDNTTAIGQYNYWYNEDKSQKALSDCFVYGEIQTDHFIPLENVTHIINPIACLSAGGEDVSLVIPSQIKSLFAGSLVLGERDRIKSISFEKENSQLEFFNLYSVHNLKNLEDIYIPQGIITVGEVHYSSEHSPELPLTIHIGSGVTKILGKGSSILNSPCSELTLDFENGGTSLEISDWVLSSSTGLKTLVLPSHLTKLGQYAFYQCSDLQTVYFNSKPNADSAQNQWFEGCPNLIDIYVPWGEEECPGAPYGATNATIHYNYTGEEGGEE